MGYIKLLYMSGMAATAIPDRIRLVIQEHTDGCGIACAAMIASVSYIEAWERLAPPPATEQITFTYHDRESTFLIERGWWATAQLLLKTVVSLEEVESMIESEERFRKAVETSHRIRFVVAFLDGSKPDHSVIWDTTCPRTLSSTPPRISFYVIVIRRCWAANVFRYFGVDSVRYQPGRPIQTLIKTEVELDPWSARTTS